MNSIVSSNLGVVAATETMRQSRAHKFRVAPLFFLALGIFSVLLFHAEEYFPISVSVLISASVIYYVLQQFIKKRIGILMLFLLVIYLLPSIHIPPYIWFDFNSNPAKMWGLAVRPYMLNERIMELTAMIVSTGSLGIAFSISLASSRKKNSSIIKNNLQSSNFSTLSLGIWSVWVFIGIGLSYIATPVDTIFEAAYTTSEAVVDNLNFSSSWMASYVVLSYTFVDAVLDKKGVRKKIKLRVITAALVYIILVWQLLRGDRAALPWAFGLVIAYYYWIPLAEQRAPSRRFPWSYAIAAAFVIFSLAMIVGRIRSNLSGSDIYAAANLIRRLYSEGYLSVSDMLHGTWSAVLLTPMSVAGDHIRHVLPYKWGQDYLNIIMSLPPGFIADLFGYVRPLTAESGPAWEMTYGLGGTHAAVVPFLNFRMIGVFIVPMLWTLMLQGLERKAGRKPSVINIALLLSIALSSAHFMWYGEKNLINAIVIWALLSFFYRISLGGSRILNVYLKSKPAS